MKRLAWNVGLSLCALASSALAGDFDGSKKLICAPVEVNDCIAVEGCVKTVPSEVGAPSFIRIDFEQNAMVGPYRASPIKLIEKTETQLLLMGTELGYAWSIALDQATGEMAATLVNRGGTYAFFGSCTPL